jgi:GNAT superfamily N-acetyltransferase
MLVLVPSLANFVRLAGVGGHQLLYHPASVADIERDKDAQRRDRTLARLQTYSRLEGTPASPLNTTGTSPNDACDNDILYSLECDAVHALVTEDREIHAKAKNRGLADRVYTIQTAEDWLKRLHEPLRVVLPNIEEEPLHALTPVLSSAFFDSLRLGYQGFDDWFRRKARENRMAWVYRDHQGELGAICIYATQEDESINDLGERLQGTSLKLCTFKVGDSVRGRKIGELFLKAAFRYATKANCEHIFIHADAERHGYLVQLLCEFGFVERGTYGSDVVLVKSHPTHAPAPNGIEPFEYLQKYFPHYRRDAAVAKYVVPIQPRFHEMLFPDYEPPQPRLFTDSGSIGNAIKLAYLCHAPVAAIKPGDLVLFYRTSDEKVITSVGVVEKFAVLSDSAKVASLVSRRTVYSLEQIDAMAVRPTKVILFRLVEHFPKPVPLRALEKQCSIAPPIQTIRKIADDSFEQILRIAGR